MVTWNPPSHPNGIITGYQVIYSVYQIPSTKMLSNVLDNTITEYFIEDLSKQNNMIGIHMNYVHMYICICTHLATNRTVDITF